MRTFFIAESVSESLSNSVVPGFWHQFDLLLAKPDGLDWRASRKWQLKQFEAAIEKLHTSCQRVKNVLGVLSQGLKITTRATLVERFNLLLQTLVFTGIPLLCACSERSV